MAGSAIPPEDEVLDLERSALLDESRTGNQMDVACLTNSESPKHAAL